MLEGAANLTPRRMNFFFRILMTLGLIGLFLYIPTILGGLFWLIHGARGWFGTRRETLSRRKRLAALFALQDGTGPQGIERYVHDDEAFGKRVGQFFQTHQIRMPVPLYDDRGRYRFRCPEKARVVATAIVGAVGRARDNELFVVLADLAELGDDLTPLVKAARAARARKHHVMLLVPWPADVPPPDDASADEATDVDAPRKKGKRRRVPEPGTKFLPVVQAALVRQYHQAFREFRRTFSRVGATVVRVNEGDPVQMILDRLDRLRGMRSRR